MGHQKKIIIAALAVALITGTSFLGDGFAKAKGAAFNNIPAPDGKGPYDVGFRIFPNGVPPKNLPKIQVYYPVDPTDPNLDPTDCPNTYTIQGTGGTYKRSSPLCAAQNAPVASGTFKMVVHNHGGGGPGTDSQLISQLPVHETLASHGIIVVVIRHAGNVVTRVGDVPKIIDFMSDPNQTPLAGSIDPNHVGISGFSTGGRTSLALTGGWAAQSFTADPRIVAMVLYEPGRDNSLDDVSTISIPYLVMGGTRMENGVVIVPEVFDTTVLATPRIRVLHPEALHFNYQTDLCEQIDETREASLPQQVEPLTNLITLMVPNTNNCVIDPSTGLCRRVCNTGQLGLAGPPPLVGAAAIESCVFWNRGENIGPLLFPLNPFAFGGGRNICNRVGVNSSQSLDDDPPPDGDGFTDAFLGGDPLIPLFEGNDFWDSNASTVEPPMLHEVSLPMIKLYTVAFFKKFLEGDGRYMRYLTPGYANTQGFDAEVEIRE